MTKEKKTTALTLQEKNISDNVLNRVAEMESNGLINFPQNYSYANAIKSAWLVLQNTLTKTKQPVLQACTKESIANSLFDMVVQGLSPAKKQCYFIAYGNKLQLSRSYLGTIAVTKRLKGVKEVFAQIIYEGDEFEYRIDLDTGLKVITKHNQSFENINPTKIKGAYAVVVRDDAPNYVEVMNIDQIKSAWAMGSGYGKSSTHKDFGDEMAKKTVINRACKIFFNTSDDSDILIQAINQTLDVDPQAYEEADVVEEVKDEIKENANSEPIDIEETPAPPRETRTIEEASQPSKSGAPF